MSKQRASKGPGVLSKVVRFVTNPTVQWSKLDSEPAADGDNESRQVLREMIQRRRRNEFVRNREFDMLRKVRRRDGDADDDTQAFAPPSISFSSLSANSGERARTLEKIDEIEAQMSRAWVKRKTAQSLAVVHGEGAIVPTSSRLQPLVSTDTVEPTTVSTRRASATVVREQTTDFFRGDFQATVVYGDQPESSSSQPWPAQAGAGEQTCEVASIRPTRPEPAPDSEMEEVAIRFANGDMAGAEAGLLDLLSAGGPRVLHQPTWLALFDLYRATGQHEKFDDAALQFAAQFGRSVPQWFSMRDGLPVTAPRATTTGSGELVHWACPASLDTVAVNALTGFMSAHAQPWRMDWRGLSAIQSSALPGLCAILQAWSRSPDRLSLVGAERLKQCLAERSPTHDRSVDPQWWSARLALLQVLHAADEFEEAALDYCVTYEVSPPAWEPPRCTVFATMPGGRALHPASADGEQPLALEARPSDGEGGDEAQPLYRGSERIPLRGEILGDADDLRARAAQCAAAGVPVELDCHQLIRVDFSAAGTLLNWVTALQAAGTPVSFVGVHRLVSVFFGVIGISGVAKVHTRAD